MLGFRRRRPPNKRLDIPNKRGEVSTSRDGIGGEVSVLEGMTVYSAGPRVTRLRTSGSEDAGVTLAQPSNQQFADGIEGALLQSAAFDRFGSVKRRFLGHFVAYPYTQRTDRSSLYHRRNERSLVNYSGDQPLGIGERNENTDRSFGLQRDAGLGAAEHLGLADNFIAGEEARVFSKARRPHSISLRASSPRSRSPAMPLIATKTRYPSRLTEPTMA